MNNIISIKLAIILAIKAHFYDPTTKGRKGMLEDFGRANLTQCPFWPYLEDSWAF